MEYREMLFLPLMALLVIDETTPSSFRGNALWEAWFIALISRVDANHHKLPISSTIKGERRIFGP